MLAVLVVLIVAATWHEAGSHIGTHLLSQVVGNLTGEGLASGAVYKEMFLSEADLAGLHSEQRGLIDFLVLAHSTRFVGFGPSTYSFFLREYRTMQARSVWVLGF